MTARTVINVVVIAALTVGFVVAVFFGVRAVWRWWLAGWRNALRVIDARRDVAPAVEPVPAAVEQADDEPADTAEATKAIPRDTYVPQPVDKFGAKPAWGRHRPPTKRTYGRKPRTDNAGRWTP